MEQPSATSRKATEVRLASSVLLVRDGEMGLEVFLVRRNASSEFMADVFVFPGGGVDESDADPAWEVHLRDFDADRAAWHLGEISPVLARAFYVAAIRETFEEGRVLLASGAPFPAPWELEEARRAWLAGALSFRDWLAGRDLGLATAALHPWDRWVTPRAQPRRFDARFFVAKMPTSQEAAHDEHEATDSVWLHPADALRQYSAGVMGFGPPQLAMLHELTAFEAVADVMAEASRRSAPLVPRLPEPSFVDGVLYLLLPGDRDYPDAALRGSGLCRARRNGALWELIHFPPAAADTSPTR